MTFKDHFSGHSGVYHQYRPGYPASLFSFVAGQASGRALAWDCGTGNGQAAIGLTPHFDRVVATDPSRAQLDRAMPHPKIRYHCVPAEDFETPAGSVDLVTVAQAVHWFDLESFYQKARSVLRPGGILALWCYNLCRIDPKVDEVVQRFYNGEIFPFWPPERRWVEEEYATLPFPFAEIKPPVFEMTAEWSLDQLIWYVSTWSAVKRFEKKTNSDPVSGLNQALTGIWGEPASVKTVHWPMGLRVGISE